MGLSFETAGGVSTARLPWTPALSSPSGRLRVGALAVLADCVSGYRAVRDFDGAWIGTSELAIHGPFRPTAGPVVATADLLRRRRTGAVYDVVVDGGDPGSPPVAVATVTLGLLSRQGERKVTETITRQADGAPASRAAPPLRSVTDLLDVEGAGPGDSGLRLEIGGGVRNSWGVLAGGIISILCELEAERAAGAAYGAPCAVEALGMHFLAPGRVGPVVARATLLTPIRSSPGGAGTGHPHDVPAHLRVRVEDAGADHRLIATATATAVPVAALGDDPPD
jgi:acyl-coenzyme A thioesterase PaaI-like protein